MEKIKAIDKVSLTKDKIDETILKIKTKILEDDIEKRDKKIRK